MARLILCIWFWCSCMACFLSCSRIATSAGWLIFDELNGIQINPKNHKSNQRELGKSNSKKRRNIPNVEYSKNWNIPKNEIHAGRLVILLSIPQTGWQPLQVFFHTFHDIDTRLLHKKWIWSSYICHIIWPMVYGLLYMVTILLRDRNSGPSTWLFDARIKKHIKLNIKNIPILNFCKTVRFSS